MLIYPDSFDLLNICRGRSQLGISELCQQLAAHSHQIVLSFDTLIEVSASLRNGLQLEVRRDLNWLENLPHIFINEARIRDMELHEALAAFDQGREYEFAAVRPLAEISQVMISAPHQKDLILYHLDIGLTRWVSRSQTRPERQETARLAVRRVLVNNTGEDSRSNWYGRRGWVRPLNWDVLLSYQRY
jgi:hypothetical protein